MNEELFFHEALEFPRPSKRLSTIDDLPAVAANRHIEPSRLRKVMRGELDWIVMKALEKDRNRRYETANGFADDVQRYLADEPVQACPPSAWYRFGKLVRRNQRALATVSLMGYVWRVAFSPDGRWLASGSWDSTIKMWDLKAPERAEPVTLRGHAGFIRSLAFSPDGRRLASASGYAGHGEVKVWDAALWDDNLSTER